MNDLATGQNPVGELDNKVEDLRIRPTEGFIRSPVDGEGWIPVMPLVDIGSNG